VRGSVGPYFPAHDAITNEPAARSQHKPKDKDMPPPDRKAYSSTQSAKAANLVAVHRYQSKKNAASPLANYEPAALTKALNRWTKT
jgi:protein subunit release factor B